MMDDTTPMLDCRREDQILVWIIGRLVEGIVEEIFTVEDIQNKLHQFVEVYGVDEPDEFFVDRVSAFFSQGS